jgi:BASS family bile acid:Na+ symporter
LLVPLAGYLLYRLFGLPIEYAIGFLLVVAAPGSPFGLKLAEIAGGEIAYATGLLLSLSVIGIISMPVTARLILPGEVQASFNIATVIGQLILLSLIPLVIGLQARQRRPVLALRLLPPVRKISTLSFILVFILVIANNLTKLTRLDIPTIIAIIAAVAVSQVIGGLLAEKRTDYQKALVVTTCMRNFGLALLVEQSSFAGTHADISIVAYALLSFFYCVGLVAYWNRRAASPRQVAKHAEG